MTTIFRRSSTRRCVALAVLAGLTIAACASDDDSGGPSGSATETEDSSDASGSSDTPSSSDAPSPSDAPASTEKGVVRVGLDLATQNNNGPTFDPVAATNSNGTPYDAIWYLVYGRLMRPNLDGSLTPELATRAEVIDPMTIEIELREGVTFSDGSPLDAAAVKAALERPIGNRTEGVDGISDEYYSLESVEVVDPLTARLSVPDGTAARWFDQFVSSWETSITKPGQTDFSNPIGAGPMKVVSYKPAESMVLEQNESYWDAESVGVAGYEFLHVLGDQPSSGMAALLSGQLDVAAADPNQLINLDSSVEAFTSLRPDWTIGVHICKADGPLADPRVRQAINKGIDRDEINEKVFQGSGVPQTQIWPDEHQFHDPALDDVLAYDPEGARELLKEAGYEDGFDLTLYSIPYFGLNETAEVFVPQMAEIGITVDFKQGGNYVNDFLVANDRAIGFYPSTSQGTDILNTWVAEDIGNVCHYDDPELNAIAAEMATVEQTSPEAAELWSSASDIVINDALSGFILYRPAIVVYDPDRVAEIDLWPSGDWLVPDPLKTSVASD